jgi:anaerobic selenocysteine-containing dehydrogenase
LEIEFEASEIFSIRGDKQDPLSRGHFCPKALALKDVQNDPDRLRHPVKRFGDQWREITWDEAFDLVVDNLVAIRSQYGPNSIGIYLGNPCVHNYGMLTHGSHFFGPLKTRNRFSATSLDQLPHHLVSYQMYGHQMLIPIPDIDQTDYFLMIGGNPVASNGSIMTVPDIKKRISALQARNGKLVVIDPRRSETARLANEHIFIRPGSDVYFLLALLNTLFKSGMPQTGKLTGIADGLDKVREAVNPYTPEAAEPITGIPAKTILRLAAELKTAKTAVCYGRMGVSVQRFGSLCQWLIQLINIVTGNLDKPGGALFTHPAFDTIAGAGSRPGHYNEWQSRVSGFPEFSGELPTAAMAEEILTPGEGQVRALVTAAANPVLTATNGTRLEKALDSLEFMVALDFYINETTRFADVILPPTFALEHDHYDIAFNVLAVRNIARYNQPLFEKPPGTLHDWEILTELGRRLTSKLGVKSRPEVSPDQMLDFALQTGPYSAQAGHQAALSLAGLKEHRHGLDLGPLKPSLPERLATENKRIQCAPDLFLNDIARVDQELKSEAGDQKSLLLISRRHLFDANSWLHNIPRLLKGRDRCRLLIHPRDAMRFEMEDGDMVRVTSRTGEVEVSITISDEMMPGVLSLPHGWGHHRPGTRLPVAQKSAGVSFNDLSDDGAVDPISGNAVLNGIPVTLAKIG